MWHLCAATDNQGLIIDARSVAELVSLSKGGSAQAQELFAAVISDLAKVCTCHASIINTPTGKEGACLRIPLAARTVAHSYP